MDELGGTCYSVTFLDSLVCQAFYNPHLLKILEQLLFDLPLPGYITAMLEKADASQEDRRSSYQAEDPLPPNSHLYSVPVPKEFHGREYGKLFEHLITKHKAIPLGLYRNKRVLTKRGKMTTVSYVLPSPPRHAAIKRDDLVYILSRPCNHPVSPL
jgi:hypothetical protein